MFINADQVKVHGTFNLSRLRLKAGSDLQLYGGGAGTKQDDEGFDGAGEVVPHRMRIVGARLLGLIKDSGLALGGVPREKTMLISGDV